MESINSGTNETQLYNRTNEINILNTLLDSSKDGSTPTILLTGFRGVGKTTIIKKLINDFEKEYLCIYIDFSHLESCPDGKLTRFSIIELIYKEIIKSCYDAELMDELNKYFIRKNISINKIIGYKGIFIPFPEFYVSYPLFSDFVMNLPQEIYDEFNTKFKAVLIFFDEFHLISNIDKNLDSFLWYLRANIQSQKNVAYTFSGSISIKNNLIRQIASKGCAFGTRILTVELKPFTFEITKKYMDENYPKLNFTNDGIERFYKCTGGIPYYINNFANLLPHDVELDSNIVLKNFKLNLSLLSAVFSYDS